MPETLTPTIEPPTTVVEPDHQVVVLTDMEIKVIYLWTNNPGPLNGTACEVVASLRHKLRETGAIPPPAEPTKE